MANQSPDRRQVLEMLAKVAVAGQFTGFARWAYAGQTSSGGSHYRAQFFTPEEYAAVDRLSELIIPADETPGAHAAGVVEFIDFMAHRDPQIQQPFREGLAWVAGKGFMRLPDGGQIELLRMAASSPVDTPGRKFFQLIRQYTVMGYYTSRVGMEQLDDPGLKMYAQSPACPHKDDPEHKNLRSRDA